MKRLMLLLPVMGLSSLLYTCSPHKTPELPKTASEVIDEAHEVLPIPRLPDVPFIIPHSAAKPVAKPKRHPTVKLKPAPAPLPPQYEEEEKPEVPTRLRCIFPFSLIPGCYVDVS